ncbi:uncharacterized protein LOC133194940 [Saccostrea echinata]|uniref:uncharacterized protein LOC133194940 n=1 Tax=Saccostrea echinata TaxID=191078 RepID=UPI002A840302|nr:uncharacterized protein LOC133194940 [Saccostrea echinata]
MPELLKQNYREQLATWIGKTCHFRLLYKISRDGCSATTFHQKCDGQGPTVTVLYNTNNTIFGGYLSQSWNSNGAHIADTNAFLFRLQYNGSSYPHKAPVNGSYYNYAGYGDGNYGPSFGGNTDLRTFQGNVSKSGNTFALSGYVQVQYYTYNGQDTNSMTNNNLSVTDLEVYLVVDGTGPKIFDKPWREPPEWNNEVLNVIIVL